MRTLRLMLPAALSMGLLACAEPAPTPPAVTVPDEVEATPAPVSASAAAVAYQPGHDPEVVHFGGFGPAAFGADEEQVRIAWGHELAAMPPSEGSSCTYLMPDPVPAEGYEVAFMMEEGAFRRYDVASPRIAAPGDVVIGDDADKVLAAFAGRVEEMPHKYVEGGRYLVVSPEQGGDARLVFEVDADGKITEWRMGLLPQVLYVEGCS